MHRFVTPVRSSLFGLLVVGAMLAQPALVFAHPGHPHFPGVSEHLPFETESGSGMATTLAIYGLLLGASFLELGMVIYRILSDSRRKLLRVIGVLMSLFFLAACGGGGGGGGGGSSSKRPGSPAIRILHGGLDVEPVHLNSPQLDAANSQFGEDQTTYVQFPEGPQNLIVERKNQPGVVVATVSAQVDGSSYYSLLLSGEINKKTFRTTLIPEPDDRAGSGRSRVQLVNALEGVSSLVLSGAGFTLGPVEFRNSSGFVELPAGIQTFSLNSTDGRSFGTVTADLVEKGQSTVLISGSTKDAVVVKKVYNDLG